MVTADRARDLAQHYLSREQEGLFALPPLLGASRGRQVWFVPVGRLGSKETVGEVSVDAATGAVLEARLP